MNKSLLTLTASAFLLAITLGTAQAQSSGDDDDTMQRGQGMMQQGQRGERMMQRGQGKKYGRDRDRRSGMMRYHRRGGMGYGHGMGYGRGMGRGGGPGMGMGHGGMMQVMFAMMDANGDGSLSLDEVQQAHARIFAHMDANDDDQVTKEEIGAFFHGGKDRRSGRWDMSDDADDLNLSDEVDDDDDD